MINRKLVGTLSIALCASMISITATASCEDLLKIANDTLAQNNPLSLEQKTALKECVKEGCQNYSWTLNCAHIRNLVNTASASTPVTAPIPIHQAPPVQPAINNTNEPTMPALNSTSKQPTTTTPTTSAQPTNGTKNSETTSTTTPNDNNVNWF